ncbi:MAG: YciI-like protein [Massilia sp.]
MHFLLIYDLAPDYLERRGEFRKEHLKLAWEAQERGEIVIAGALADPADRAVLLFSGESSDAAERFVRADPYVVHGLVTQWHVRPWITVVGDDASNPVRPE